MAKAITGHNAPKGRMAMAIAAIPVAPPTVGDNLRTRTALIKPSLLVATKPSCQTL